MHNKRIHGRLIAATGKGRSKVLENMIRENIKAGEGVCLIDPHGDLSNSIIRYLDDQGLESRILKVIGKHETLADFDKLINSRKVIIWNLACNKLSSEDRVNKGREIIDRIRQAAYTRFDSPLEEREFFHVYIDGFSSFVGEKIAGALPELRKYWIRLILSDDSLEQLRQRSEKIYAAVMTNTERIELN
jgi:hypothetical protein